MRFFVPPLLCTENVERMREQYQPFIEAMIADLEVRVQHQTEAVDTSKSGKKVQECGAQMLEPFQQHRFVCGKSSLKKFCEQLKQGGQDGRKKDSCVIC